MATDHCVKVLPCRFEKDVESQLKRGVDIATRIKRGWKFISKQWVVGRTFSWVNKSRRLSKDYEFSLLSAQSMCMVAAFRTLISRFYPIGTGYCSAYLFSQDV